MIIRDELEEILSLLEKNYFINVHDKTEELWRKYKNNKDSREESFILKSFVNAFAFFELIKMQRYEHAQKIWQIYKKYEHLIDGINSINKVEYKKIQKMIYEKKEEIQK